MAFTKLVKYLTTHAIDSVNVNVNVNVDANAGDRDGMTPLHWASHHGHLEVVKTLLGVSEVDVNKDNNERETALGLPEWARGGGEGPPGSQGGCEQGR